MRTSSSSLLLPILLLSFATPPALAADAELDALNLESAPETPAPKARNTKMFVEGAAGQASQRYQSNNRNTGRASFDLTHSSKLTPGLRVTVSNRTDHFIHKENGVDDTVNSLREGYVSWQPEGGSNVLEFGRINLRYGPAYGYNPTDFFRDGSLRVLTTADPFALRENRMGTVMLRGQHLFNKGSVSLAISPKLADKPSMDGWDLDLGSTNNRDRYVLALSGQYSERVSGQALLYQERGRSATVGMNITALVSDGATAHMELTRGTEPDVMRRALAPNGESGTRNRFVAGMTYTTLGKLSVTAEYQYNGFGIKPADWTALNASPGTQLAYLQGALRLQELAPREAYLVYVTQRGLGLKDLDLTAYVRMNPGDGSKLTWMELRHHWANYDLALQWQQNSGSTNSEFGLVPDRRLVQVLGNYRF